MDIFSTYWLGTSESGFTSLLWRRVKIHKSSLFRGEMYVAVLDIHKPYHERSAKADTVENAVAKLARMLGGKYHKGARAPIPDA